MKIQVLASVMYEEPYTLIKRMNLKTDAIIINQCDKNEIEIINKKDCTITFISTTQRGIGKSRNLALKYATADICIFADNDIVYNDDYQEIILNEFKKTTNIDVIFFSFKEQRRPTKIKWYNSMKYGAPITAIRLSSVQKFNIKFSLLFGGGAKYSCGEDSLFISECLKNNLKLRDSGLVLGHFIDNESTWFVGYTEKYFKDKGALFCAISKKYAKLLCLQFVIRKGNIFKREFSRGQAFKLMIEGVQSF